MLVDQEHTHAREPVQKPHHPTVRCPGHSREVVDMLRVSGGAGVQVSGEVAQAGGEGEEVVGGRRRAVVELGKERGTLSGPGPFGARVRL